MLKVVGGDCARPGARGSTGGGAGLGAASRCRARWVSRVPVSSAVSRADNVHRYLSSLRRGGGASRVPPLACTCARVTRLRARLVVVTCVPGLCPLAGPSRRGARGARAGAAARACAKDKFWKAQTRSLVSRLPGVRGWGVGGVRFLLQDGTRLHSTRNMPPHSPHREHLPIYFTAACTVLTQGHPGGLWLCMGALRGKASAGPQRESCAMRAGELCASLSTSCML